MKTIDFQFGDLFQNRAVITSFPNGYFDVTQKGKGINASFVLHDVNHKPLYTAHFENVAFLKRGLIVERPLGGKVGTLIPTPKFGTKFGITLSNGQEFTMNGWNRNLEIFRGKAVVGNLKLEHMVGAKYRLLLHEGLDLAAFFLFACGAIILRDNLLL